MHLAYMYADRQQERYQHGASHASAISRNGRRQAIGGQGICGGRVRQSGVVVVSSHSIAAASGVSGVRDVHSCERVRSASMTLSTRYATRHHARAAPDSG